MNYIHIGVGVSKMSHTRSATKYNMADFFEFFVLFCLFIGIWSTGNINAYININKDGSYGTLIALLLQIHIQVWTETRGSLPAYAR